MVFLDHVQNLHIHAVRAKILWSIFEPDDRLYGRCGTEFFHYFMHMRDKTVCGF